MGIVADEIMHFIMDWKKVVLGSAAMLTLVGCDRAGADKEAKMREVARSVVTDMLEKEPELFVAAIDKAVQKQQRQAAQAIEEAATNSQAQMWSSPLVMGNKDAKVRLAVFFDPLEPVSQKFRTEVMEPLVKERSDVGFFLIPVSVYAGGAAEGGQGAAPSSVTAAQALIAASWQDAQKALAFWGKMPNINKEFTAVKMRQIAGETGLSVDQLFRDTEGESSHQVLVANGQLAVNLRIPLQLPVIFILNKDGKLSMIPPFIKAKMIRVFDAVMNGRSWEEALQDTAEQGQNKPEEKGAPATKEQNAGLAAASIKTPAQPVTAAAPATQK